MFSKFLQQFRTPLSPLQVARLSIIDQTDFSKVAIKVRQDLAERGVIVDDDYIAGGIEALKQYYAIALLDPANMHAVSDVVDPFWHAHILFTEDYVSFCERVVGRYMHHDPLDKTDAKALVHVRRIYDYTRSSFRQLLRKVDSRWWPEGSDRVVVCLHMNSYDPELMRDTLFPFNPAMQPAA